MTDHNGIFVKSNTMMIYAPLYMLIYEACICNENNSPHMYIITLWCSTRHLNITSLFGTDKQLSRSDRFIRFSDDISRECLWVTDNGMIWTICRYDLNMVLFNFSYHSLIVGHLTVFNASISRHISPRHRLTGKMSNNQIHYIKWV